MNSWKIAREFKRLRQQMAGLGEALTEPWRQKLYDRDRLSRLALQDGQAPLTDKICLLMIYQPTGLAPALVETCRHLVAQGYAPFVISNGALAQPDRADLLPQCWRLAERPNYGYDFGAYRDGILALKDWRIAPETVLILNDSIWFPLYPDDDLLLRLEAAPADICGTVLRHRRPSWRSLHRREARFLESYCYRITGKAFAHPAFDAFWRSYRLTDNKYKVIRRGERGFSRAMQAAGLSVQALFTEQVFLAAVAAQSTPDLGKTLLYAAYSDHRMERRRLDLLARYGTDPAWREEALDHIRQATAGWVFNSAFCYPTITLLHANYLKKSGERINVLWRQRFLAAVGAGDIPPPAAPFLEDITRRDA